MAFAELDSPIPAIPAEEQPDIMAYSLLQGFVADLQPRPTTPAMDIWTEFRYRYTGEVNFPRWSTQLEIEGIEHTVALCTVAGERPGGTAYAHTALRCSCCLPDTKSFTDLAAGYQSCPGKDAVIQERVGVYRELFGANQLGPIRGKTLKSAATFLLEMASRTTHIWPPSDRSDRLLIEPMAEVYGVSMGKMMKQAEALAEDEVVVIHGGEHPSMSLKVA